MDCRNLMVLASGLAGLAGCSHIEFQDDRLYFFEPVPYVFVSTDKDCTSVATVVSIPGERRYLKFAQGYGAAELSVNFDKGMLASVGQKVDNRAPELITALAGLRTAPQQATGSQSLRESGIGNEREKCPSAVLYRIRDGSVNPNERLILPYPAEK